MRWHDVVKRFNAQPIVDSRMLGLAGGEAPSSFRECCDPAYVQVQISRWVNAGKLLQLRRGFYVLAEPYRKVQVHAPSAASIIYRPSYISLEYALSYYGLIPEAVPNITSITTRRPVEFLTPLGTFTYRHVKRGLFWGYQSQDHAGQTAFYALAEKALLDIFYFRHEPLEEPFFEEMRFQNLEGIDFSRLKNFAGRFKSKRIERGASALEAYAGEMKRGFTNL